MQYTATTYEAFVKQISVKQAAAALGVSNRAVIYKLEKGELKGRQAKNPYGVNEWRIYPSKEIADKLRLSPDDANETTFDPSVIDAIELEAVSTNEEPAGKEPVRSWVTDEREKLRMLVEEMMKPLVETIRTQERELEEQSRQLKLLPDLQKRAEQETAAAEEQRRQAELKALEVEALNKQIAMLQDKVLDEKLLEEKAVTEAELSQVKARLEEERTNKETEVKALLTVVATLEEHKKAAEEAQRTIEELKQLQETEAKRMEAEITSLAQKLEAKKFSWRKFLLGSN